MFQKQVLKLALRWRKERAGEQTPQLTEVQLPLRAVLPLWSWDAARPDRQENGSLLYSQGIFVMHKWQTFCLFVCFNQNSWLYKKKKLIEWRCSKSSVQAVPAEAPAMVSADPGFQADELPLEQHDSRHIFESASASC